MTDLTIALFDFDGTLCDSAASIIRLTRHACAIADVPEPSVAQIRKNIGEGLFAAGLDYASGDEDKAQIIFDSYRLEARREFTLPKTDIDPLFDGAKTALEQLANQGFLLGIVTNKGRHGLGQMMARHGIDHLIDISFTADDTAVKPAPDMAMAALAHFDIAPHRAVLVGDTVNDGLCAKGAGVPFIGVDWGYHDNQLLRDNGAVHIATDFKDLTAAIHQIVGSEE